MNTNLRLQYYSTAHIMEYIARHPVDWCGAERQLAQRGGLADSAGLPPIPTMQIFFQTLTERGALFDQEQLWAECLSAWGDSFPTRDKMCEAALRWPTATGESIRHALRVKCFRNFYPSAIDSLHVFGLLVESGIAEWCTLDCARDVIGSIDLTIGIAGKGWNIALVTGSRAGQECLNYKRRARSATECDFTILLPMSRAQAPGNKRWYESSDLDVIRDKVCCLPNSIVAAGVQAKQHALFEVAP